ncbi:MAG: alpha/beta hydrolase [Chloroflexota bacterium]|nr:alpha/beta hydrolase [Chloroflexota bacterium]
MPFRVAPTAIPMSFTHDTNRLVGDLTVGASGAAPTVVLVWGSGPGGRRWEDVPQRFAAAGFSFFAYDRPGSGESTGDWRRMTFEDRADEVVAALEALVRRPEVDPEQLWLFGGSQGGWVAPLAATRYHDLAGLLLQSPPAVGVVEQESYRLARQVDPEDADRAVEAFAGLITKLRAGLDSGPDLRVLEADRVPGSWQEAVLEAVGAPGSPDLAFLAGIIDHDPVPVLQAIRCPLLAVFGEEDALVPVGRSIEALEAALTMSGHADHRIAVFPGADHGLRVAGPDGRVHVPGFIELVIAWLARRTRVPYPH